ncbi:hypothetical protein BLNAU_22166 [Blattamonas nauphoetae]|uniref:Uncharacterized protein n=1 Tax=Blattamonas nauphoetae TaxID=2049346 RepID=A0ABQ9WTT8_9EUKA|nr:hypothetical protein BLNAU_22166 [Blattamonas nauphoetae]
MKRSVIIDRAMTTPDRDLVGSKDDPVFETIIPCYCGTRFGCGLRFIEVQRSLAWSDEAGVGVLMSAELIAEDGAMDEERVMEWIELACQCLFFSSARSASNCFGWTMTRTMRAFRHHLIPFLSSTLLSAT